MFYGNLGTFVVQELVKAIVKNPMEKLRGLLGALGSQKRGFALCMPIDLSDVNAFEWGLIAELGHRLHAERQPFLFYCPVHHSSETVQDSFHKQIERLTHLHTTPEDLLVIWPGLCAEVNASAKQILEFFRHLISCGCRIHLINEFPEPLQGFDDVLSKLTKIWLDEEAAADHLVKYMKELFGKNPRVLMINATQSFTTAVRRRDALEKRLRKEEITPKPVNIESWKQDESKRVLLEVLRGSDPTETYDVIAAANDSMAIGADEALAEYSKEKRERVERTVVFGFDGLQPAIQRIRNPRSRLVATIGADPDCYLQTVWHAKNGQPTKDPILIPIRYSHLITRGKLLGREPLRR